MTWTATVSLDPDKTDIGSASVTWDAGGADEFVYTERLEVTQAAGFKTRAIAARDAFFVHRANEQTRATQLTTLMNAP